MGDGLGARRVFAIWSNALFRESVLRILQHPEVLWLGATSDQAAAREQIARLRPDTIVIEEGNGGICLVALEFLAACQWDVCVLALSLADNKLTVYHREQQTLGRAEDLLRLIQGD